VVEKREEEREEGRRTKEEDIKGHGPTAMSP